MIYEEVEYRLHLVGIKQIPDFLGMIFFANAVTATNRNADITLFEYVTFGLGTGLRIMKTPAAALE